MSKPILILTAVLAVQIVIYAVVSIDPARVEEKEPFLTVDTSKVDYLKITNEDGEIVLNRVGSKWKITDPYDYPANPRYVQTLLEKVEELEIETFITDNADKFPMYELDELAAKYVEIGAEGGTVEKFYCGKASDTYTHTYIRRADSDDVYLVAGTPRSSFTRRPKDWRDKSILALDRTMVERILLHHPGETIELVRTIATPGDDTTLTENDTTWLATTERGASFEPVEKVMNRILNTLKRLNAIDFLDAGTDTIPNFSNPEFSVEAFLEGDEHHTMDFIPKADEETRWIGRKDGDESTVYVIYQSSVKNMKKNVAALKGEEEEDDDDV